MNSSFLILFVLLILMVMLNCYHPISMAMVLISFALILSFFLMKLTASWLGYVMALVFLGGVMVVLMFSVSICGNEKMIFSKNMKLLVLLPSIFIPSSVFFRSDLKVSQMANSLYQIDQTSGLIFIIFLLLLCMVTSVMVVKLDFGPLVKRL